MGRFTCIACFRNAGGERLHRTSGLWPHGGAQAFVAACAVPRSTPRSGCEVFFDHGRGTSKSELRRWLEEERIRFLPAWEDEGRIWLAAEQEKEARIEIRIPDTD